MIRGVHTPLSSFTYEADTYPCHIEIHEQQQNILYRWHLFFMRSVVQNSLQSGLHYSLYLENLFWIRMSGLRSDHCIQRTLKIKFGSVIQGKPAALYSCTSRPNLFGDRFSKI